MHVSTGTIAARPQPSEDRGAREAAWPPSPTLPGERALTTFAFLWAFAALFHQAAYPGGAVGLSALMVTLPAIWVLLRPSSLVAAYLLRLVPDDRRVINIIQECVRLFWVLYGAGLIVILLLVARSAPIRPPVRGLDSLRLPRVSAGLFPALLFLNGLSPYLGLKTEASFAMFSNLRTEAGRWNHLFVPPQVKVAGYQDDVVQVIEPSNRSLQSVARRKQLLTHHDFRTRASRDPNASVTYRRNGELHRVARVADHPTLATPPSLWERQLLRFRAIDPPGRRIRCQH
jgi:hypothetical protein